MASYTPGVEISGGSLGHGLACCHRAWRSACATIGQPDAPQCYNLLSDGELERRLHLGGRTGLRPPRPGQRDSDRRRQRLAGRRPDRTTVLRTEPITDKWQAFGWHALRVDGNDIEALVAGFDELRGPRRLARRC